MNDKLELRREACRAKIDLILEQYKFRLVAFLIEPSSQRPVNIPIHLLPRSTEPNTNDQNSQPTDSVDAE